MLKQLPVILFLSLIICKGFAQKSTLTLFVGPSFPVGTYADKSLEDARAGFAGFGEQVNISYDYKVGRYLSLSFMLYGQRNNLNTKAMASALSDRKDYAVSPVVFGSNPGLPPISSGTYATYPNWKIDKSRWLMGSAMVGVSADFPYRPNSKLSLIVRLMAGAVYVSSPKLNGSSVTDTVAAYATQKSESGVGVSFLTRTGIKYNFSKKWFFIAAIDYFSSTDITFHDVSATFTTTRYNNGLPQMSSTTITADGKQVISAFNLSLGVGVRF